MPFAFIFISPKPPRELHSLILFPGSTGLKQVHLTVISWSINIYICMYTYERKERHARCAGSREVYVYVYIYTPCQPSLLSKIEQCHRVLFLFRPARLLGGGCSVVPALRGFPTLLCVCVCNYAGVSVTMGWCVIVHLAWWWLLQRCWSCWSCFVSPFLSIFVFLFCTQCFRGIPDHIFITDILGRLFTDWVPARSIIWGTLKGESSVCLSMLSHVRSPDRGTFEIKRK